ncbi:SMC family ATPase [Actinokineospora sp. NBRC 105648]|uniref:AAA family ATPase n=1 Tax=Actinokineospora sp. NBRC 105648 TaxID=3032206 RepID=UPI0024A17FEC|nr:SMC family ATPase [Actinokineospora sp. NBRC 105648]GLZ41205.1 nuclease SbcCD subunit C [Actinokineospora sp. NBRC 105648]
MRLHHLELSAFGPFAGHETVDFDRLAAEGLFLLHGDTGAGKTTVLDAVAFALFGAVPGARAEAKRLRCDYADPDTHTEVTLELTVQGHRLRLTRSPEYERPKRRGGGTTKQNAKASLTWVGTPPSGHRSEGVTRIDEVARTVERLLGMTKDQFFQVVLLPQGEFARFLRASTEEREHLLEKLFGTQHFERVEKWFRERRVECRRVLEETRYDSRELLARFVQAAGVEAPEDSDLLWLNGIVQSAEKADQDAANAEADTRVRLSKATAAFDDGRDLVKRVDRVHRAVNGLAELATQAGERALWRDELLAAQQAIPVVAAEDLLRKFEQAEERAEQAVRERVDAAAAKGFESADVPLPLLRQQVGQLREEAGGLAALVAEAERQSADKRRLSVLVERAETVAAQAEQASGRMRLFPDRVADAREQLARAATARAALDGLRVRRDELDSALKDQRALPGKAEALRGAEAEHRRAVDAHQAARDLLQELRQRRLDGMAAELAAGLVDDAACPVCGSVEHPAPAHAVSAAATEADERTALASEQRALRARNLALEKENQARTAVSVVTERLVAWDGQDLAVVHARALAEFRAAHDLAARHDALASGLAGIERELEALRDSHAKLERETVGLGSEAAELRATIELRQSTLDAARGGHADVAARRVHLLTVVTAVDALIDRHQAARVARERVLEQRDALADAVSTAGFGDLAEALGAARADTVIEKLRERLDEADTASQQHRATLADPELFGIEADLEVDLAPLSEAVLVAQEASRRAAGVAHEAGRRVREVVELGGRLRAAWESLAPLEAEFAELDALTDVVNGRGQNSTRMSLRSYVLAARLEEVAVAATERLRLMTQGRYAFEHSAEAGARGTRGGLGLDVLDDYSGQTRSAKTLSGGESFVASLALALGLADVVAAESGGGALLDTLFVDEGFGSLDSGTLDEVMSILDDLRDGGRVVGLVSHVDEMRQRIPTRLLVSKARGGSSLAISG